MRRKQKEVTKENYSKSKGKNIKIYYIVIFIFILSGFFIGSEKRVLNHGYEYITGYKEYPSMSGKGSTKLPTYEYIGDFTEIKNIRWYIIPLINNYKYLLGININSPLAELDYDTINKTIPISNKSQLSKDDFNYIYYANIVAFVIICIILVALPHLLSFVMQNKAKRSNKKKIKSIKELEDMEKFGMITKEEFEEKKKQLLK